MAGGVEGLGTVYSNRLELPFLWFANSILCYNHTDDGRVVTNQPHPASVGPGITTPRWGLVCGERGLWSCTIYGSYGSLIPEALVGWGELFGVALE